MAAAGGQLRRRWQSPLAAALSGASRGAYRDATPLVPAAAALLRAASARGAPLTDALPPWGGFAAGALHVRQCHLRGVAPLAARRLHSSPLSQDARPGPGSRGEGSAGGEALTRDLHSSALATARDDSAPPRECDIDDLAEARAEAARALKTANGNQGGRLSGAGRVASSVVAWTASVPGKLLGLARMSRAEWATMLNGFWVAIKKEAHHFWVGSKLLYAEMRISARLVGCLLKGNALSRRERKQLTRTTADMFRLVPLLVIVVVPFMELALPVLLKVFPNMLPSTFQDKLKHEESLKAQLTAKLELAKFLQDTTEEMAKMLSSKRTGDVQATAAELYDFMKRVRSGAPVSNDDIKKFAKLFNDEITLDSVDRVQLVNMCKFVNIPAYGTDTFLRYQLRAALRNIKADDRLIASEGVETLTYDELRAACRSRGMRWDGESTTSMRKQLEDWLELSLGAALPSSLLILSRAFTITHQRLEDPESAAVSDLEATLASLPDEVLKKVELEACANEDTAAQKLRRLESLRHEEEMIAEEAADRQDAQAAAQAAAALAASSRDLALEEMKQPLLQPAQQPPSLPSEAAAAAVEVAEAAEPPRAPLLDEVSADELTAAVATERRRQARRVARALATLAGASPVASERAEFSNLLRKEVDRYEELLESGEAARVLSADGPSRLSARLSKLLSGLEHELDRVDASIGQKLHRLDLNKDGRLDRAELAGAAAGLLRDALQGEDLRSVLGDAVFDSEGNIKLADLIALAQEDDEDGQESSAPTADEERAAAELLSSIPTGRAPK